MPAKNRSNDDLLELAASEARSFAVAVDLLTAAPVKLTKTEDRDRYRVARRNRSVDLIARDDRLVGVLFIESGLVRKTQPVAVGQIDWQEIKLWLV